MEEEEEEKEKDIITEMSIRRWRKYAAEQYLRAQWPVTRNAKCFSHGICENMVTNIRTRPCKWQRSSADSGARASNSQCASCGAWFKRDLVNAVCILTRAGRAVMERWKK